MTTFTRTSAPVSTGTFLLLDSLSCFFFQLTVYFISTFIAWIIPDIPEELEYKKKREKELEKAIIHDHVNSNF